MRGAEAAAACLPACLPPPPPRAGFRAQSHAQGVLTTRGTRDLRVPTRQAGNRSGAEAASKAATAITSKEGQTGQPSGTHLCCPSSTSFEYKCGCPQAVTTWSDCPIASSHKRAEFFQCAHTNTQRGLTSFSTNTMRSHQLSWHQGRAPRTTTVAPRYRHTGDGVQAHSCTGTLQQSHCGYSCTNHTNVKLDMPQRTILPLSLCKIRYNTKPLAGSVPSVPFSPQRPAVGKGLPSACPTAWCVCH